MNTAIGYLIALLTFVGASFFVGRSSGYKKASGQVKDAETAAHEAKADAQASKAEAEARIDAVNEAEDIRETIQRTDDAAVTQQLHNRWQRPGD